MPKGKGKGKATATAKAKPRAKKVIQLERTYIPEDDASSFPSFIEAAQVRCHRWFVCCGRALTNLRRFKRFGRCGKSRRSRSYSGCWQRA